MIADPILPVVALATSAAASVVWAIVLVRAWRAWRRRIEHRWSEVMMAGTALLASLGMLASAIGFSMQRALIPEFVPQDLMSFAASIGRGAILMAGIIVVTHYRPPERQ